MSADDAEKKPERISDSDALLLTRGCAGHEIDLSVLTNGRPAIYLAARSCAGPQNYMILGLSETEISTITSCARRPRRCSRWPELHLHPLPQPPAGQAI
jgi:hypothetical protein